MIFGAPVYHLMFVSHRKATRKRQHFLKVGLLLRTQTKSAPERIVAAAPGRCARLPPSTGAVVRAQKILLYLIKPLQAFTLPAASIILFISY